MMMIMAMNLVGHLLAQIADFLKIKRGMMCLQLEVGR